jgi:hypothetical protein
MSSQLEYFDGVQVRKKTRVSQNPTDGPSHKTWIGNGQPGSADSWREIAGNVPRKPTGGRFIYSWAMGRLIYNLGWSKLYIYFSTILSFLVNLAHSNHGFYDYKTSNANFVYSKVCGRTIPIHLQLPILWGKADFYREYKNWFITCPHYAKYNL